MALQMKRFAYFLVVLLLGAQLDEAWAEAPVLPSAPLAADNDDYLPATCRAREEHSPYRQEPLLDGLKPRTAEFWSARSSVPSERNLTAPLAPTSLYVFMSLQI